MIENKGFITVESAQKIIFDHIPAFESQTVDIFQAAGRILKEDIYADRDLPPFDKSLMDGIAIQYQDFQEKIRTFKITGVQAAGQAPLKIMEPGQCAQIMTGAVVPHGADCVIPVENVQIKDDSATINDSLILGKYQNIRQQGCDQRQGQRIISKDTLLTPANIAIAASVGKKEIKVSKLISAAVISNGDELVDIDADLKPYQIRKSNSYFLKAALEQTKLVSAELFHFPDNKEILFKEIKEILNKFDIVILTGGVSMGKFDFIPAVLESLGVELLFHKVQQKPGKPFWFGLSSQQKPVFALPGNPLATQVCAYRYIIPSLNFAVGNPLRPEYAVLSEDVKLTTQLTFFLPVKVNCNENGVIEAQPLRTGGSGDLASVSESDGFMQIPAGVTKANKGEIGEIYRWNRM